MSHYAEIKMQLTDVDACVEALLATGFTKSQIEDHRERPAALRDYAGRQTDKQAHLVVRRQHIGPTCNDFGIEFTQGKDARVHLCDFAERGTTPPANPVAAKLGNYGKWRDKFRQQYSLITTKKSFARQGKRVSEVREHNGRLYAFVRG